MDAPWLPAPELRFGQMRHGRPCPSSFSRLVVTTRARAAPRPMRHGRPSSLYPDVPRRRARAPPSPDAHMTNCSWSSRGQRRSGEPRDAHMTSYLCWTEFPRLAGASSPEFQPKVARDPIAFFRDPIAFIFVYRDSIANFIPPQLFSPHTTHQTTDAFSVSPFARATKHTKKSVLNYARVSLYEGR